MAGVKRVRRCSHTMVRGRTASTLAPARQWAIPQAPLDAVPARLSRILRRLGRGAAGLRRAFHAVAPDQRGYARSSKPEGLEAYRVKNLVRDILALGDHLSPGRPFVLVAHDWGASVAYATAIAAPNRIARLVVINGVHPGPFQRALIEDEAQRGPAPTCITCAPPRPRSVCPPTISRSCWAC